VANQSLLRQIDLLWPELVKQPRAREIIQAISKLPSPKQQSYALQVLCDLLDVQTTIHDFVGVPIVVEVDLHNLLEPLLS
jgi:hypothetical protein